MKLTLDEMRRKAPPSTRSPRVRPRRPSQAHGGVHSAAALALISAIAPVALSQDLSSRLQPAAALRTFDGYYDVATGRLVRGISPPLLEVPHPCGGTFFPDWTSVYNNTCTPTSWMPLNPASQSGGSAAEELGDYGGMPSELTYGSGCAFGCDSAYDIEQFEIAWCSQEAVRLDATVRFWSPPHHACSESIPTLHPPTFSLDLSGLPRAAQEGVTSCYSLNVLLGAPGFELGATDDLNAGLAAGDKFAWSLSFPTSAGATGPALSGDDSPAASCPPCVGTIWSTGGQSDIAGMGAGQDRFVFLESYGGTSTPAGNCYRFGDGNPSGMYLRLRSATPCPLGFHCTSFCDVVDNSLSACPCGPGNDVSGCDSPVPPMQGGGLTGGVSLLVTAQSFSPMNRATMTSTGYPRGSSPGVVLFRNSDLDPAAPVVFGDGLRCVNGPGVTRLGGTTAVNGTAVHTFAHGTMMGTGTFFYQAWFRSLPASYCDPSAAFNLSNGRFLDW